MNLNSSPSPFPIQQIGETDDSDQPFGSSPYSSSVSCRIFFNSTQDHLGYYHDHPQLYQPRQHISDESQHGYNHGGSTYEINNKVDQSGLKLTLWKKEDDHGHEENIGNPVKWMSSKMRLMQKMKKTPRDRLTLKITSTAKNSKLDDYQKQQPSSSLDQADNLSSNSSSYAAIRVCSDCNTTKTPLWRSGPKGPKSLCNACGIRQRKARRAMAAAAAAANGTAFGTSDQPAAPAMKIKAQHKDKIGKNGHSLAPLKKRFKTAINAATGEAGSTSNNAQKKIGFEDFLINLSKNLSFHRVFPEDEKDAAILLMALSSGLVHG